MHIASFDIVGPLKTSYRGNTHYLSWIDHFSRYPEAIPLSETTSEAIAKAFVENIVSRYGVSQILLSDRGSNFVSKLMQSICKLLGVKRIMSSPRHPQANGLCRKTTLHHQQYSLAVCGLVPTQLVRGFTTRTSRHPLFGESLHW